MESKILGAIKLAWGWIGIRPQKLYWLNKFGNIIVKDEGGCYWLLRPEELLCEIVARTEQEMTNLWKDDDFILDWEMTSMIEIAENSFGENESGRCFYFVIPPVLGGKYELENMQTIPLLELIGSTGSIAEQIKDVPDGSRIKLVITD